MGTHERELKFEHAKGRIEGLQEAAEILADACKRLEAAPGLALVFALVTRQIVEIVGKELAALEERLSEMFSERKAGRP